MLTSTKKKKILEKKRQKNSFFFLNILFLFFLEDQIFLLSIFFFYFCNMIKHRHLYIFFDHLLKFALQPCNIVCLRNEVNLLAYANLRSEETFFRKKGRKKNDKMKIIESITFTNLKELTNFCTVIFRCLFIFFF